MGFIDRMLYKGLRAKDRASSDLLRSFLMESGYGVSSDRIASGQLKRHAFYIDDFGFVAFDNKAGENGRHKYVAVGEATSFFGRAVYVVRGSYDDKNPMQTIVRDVGTLPERAAKNLFVGCVLCDVLLSPFSIEIVHQLTDTEALPKIVPIVAIPMIGGLVYLGRKAFEAYLRTEGVEYGASAIRSILEDDIDENVLREVSLKSIEESKAELSKFRAELDEALKDEDPKTP